MPGHADFDSRILTQIVGADLFGKSQLTCDWVLMNLRRQRIAVYQQSDVIAVIDVTRYGAANSGSRFMGFSNVNGVITRHIVQRDGGVNIGIECDHPFCMTAAAEHRDAKTRMCIQFIGININFITVFTR